MDPNSNLIWIDLEMTGLDPEQDRIIEIATLVTDSNLKILAEGPVLAIHQPDSILNKMDEWCTKTHGKSGLSDRVKKSEIKEKQAEAETLNFIKAYSEPKSSPLCGNSVWQDRRFLARYMAQLESFFHYRNIDVSTIKELARRWKPDLLEKVQKKDNHRALEDIKESIEELRLYQKHFFKI